MTADAPSRELLDWVSRTAGAPVARWSLHPASGRSRRIWLLEPAGAPDRPLLLRGEAGSGPFAGTEFTLAREAAVLRSLAGSGVPVPRVYGVTGDGGHVLMRLLPGSAELDPTTPAGRAALTDYCATLARLHRLDPHITPLPRPAGPEEHPALLDLAVHRRSYRRLCPAHPVAERAFDRLWDRLPAPPERVGVLHGDAGPGNFLHAHGRVTGLVDWEMAHVGDPMDDLAWLWFRIAVLRAAGPDPTVLERAYRDYAGAAGREPDPARIDYYCLAVLLRCLVATLVRRHHDPAAEEPVARMTALVEAALDSQIETGRIAGTGRLPALPVPE